MSNFIPIRPFKHWQLPWHHHRPRIGIEISSSSVQVVAIECYRKQWYVRACGVEVFDGDPEDVAVQQKALIRLLMRLGVRQGFVSVTMSTPVMSRKIFLPSGLADDEIDLLIRLDADKYIPYPLGEVSFDFWVLSDDGHEMSVLLVAVRTSMVDRCTEIVAAAGLDVLVVDVHEYALASSVLPMMLGLSGVVVVAHIDDIKTHVYAVRLDPHHSFAGFDYHQECLNHMPSVSDDIHSMKDESDHHENMASDDNEPTDGLGFYEFLAQYGQSTSKDIDSSDKESSRYSQQNTVSHQHSLDYEIRFDEAVDVEDIAVSKKSSNTSFASCDFSKHITANIQKILSSYESSTQTKVGTVILSGQSDENLVAQLSRVVDIPVYLADPFQEMSIGRGVSQVELDRSSRLAVACGLAVRAFDGIN